MAREDEDDWVSKSQRKRDAQTVLALTRRLTQMRPGKRAELGLPANIEHALAKAAQTSSHIAKKRDLSFAAKLLRGEDTETLMRRLDELEDRPRQVLAREPLIAGWGERLCNPDMSAAAVAALMAREDVDRQHLRNLIRNAQRKADARANLLAALRELDANQALPSPPR